MAEPYAYPLCWPEGWRRSKRRERSHFNDKLTVADSVEELILELKRWRAKNVIVSTNIETLRDGSLRKDRRPPDDTGVAIYFTDRSGKAMSLAVDKYDRVEHNIRAIWYVLDALRRIERHGSPEILERAFMGFAALPESGSMRCWEVLGIEPTNDQDTIRAAYRAKAKKVHPDAGGSDHEFSELTEALDMALKTAQQA